VSQLIEEKDLWDERDEQRDCTIYGDQLLDDELKKLKNRLSPSASPICCGSASRRADTQKRKFGKAWKSIRNSVRGSARFIVDSVLPYAESENSRFSAEKKVTVVVNHSVMEFIGLCETRYVDSKSGLSTFFIVIDSMTASLPASFSQPVTKMGYYSSFCETKARAVTQMWPTTNGIKSIV
jgi:hypothetical protein